jgi:inorganic pyrophosphatase
MRHFFTVYKHLENKETVVDEVGDENAAVAIIKAAIKQYDEDFGGASK